MSYLSISDYSSSLLVDYKISELSEFPKAKSIALIWASFAESSLARLDPSSEDSRRMSDCHMMCLILSVMMGEPSIASSETYVCKDLFGRPQAFMSISIDSNQVKIIEIVTNPENLIPPSLRKGDSSIAVKGAGRHLILRAIQRAIDLRKPILSLLPLDSAVGFYKKMGFDEIASGKGSHMVLTSDKIWHMYPRLILPGIAA